MLKRRLGRKTIKEEAMIDILVFETSYRRSTLFMIRKKYLDLDLSDMELT